MAEVLVSEWMDCLMLLYVEGCKVLPEALVSGRLDYLRF
jgi:hypothetical protein